MAIVDFNHSTGSMAGSMSQVVERPVKDIRWHPAGGSSSFDA
jgi:hypothetical protein